MNRLQAMEYDFALDKSINICAKQYGIDERLGRDIVDKFVEFYPDDEIKELVCLGQNTASYKLGNVQVDLKKALFAGLELLAAANTPESIFNYIQLLIISILFIKNATRLELNGIEPYIVYLLHKGNTYEQGIEEGVFVHEVEKYFSEKKVEEKLILETINHLYQIKVIDIIDGKIFLRERVWGNME